MGLSNDFSGHWRPIGSPLQPLCSRGQRGGGEGGDGKPPPPDPPPSGVSWGPAPSLRYGPSLLINRTEDSVESRGACARNGLRTRYFFSRTPMSHTPHSYGLGYRDPVHPQCLLHLGCFTPPRPLVSPCKQGESGTFLWAPGDNTRGRVCVATRFQQSESLLS